MVVGINKFLRFQPFSSSTTICRSCSTQITTTVLQVMVEVMVEGVWRIWKVVGIFPSLAELPPPTRPVTRDLGYQVLSETRRNIGEHFISGAYSSIGLINEIEWGRHRADHLVRIEALCGEYKVHFHRHINWLAVNNSINDIVYQDLYFKENLIPKLDDKNFQHWWVSQGGHLVEIRLFPNGNNVNFKYLLIIITIKWQKQ